MRTIDGAHGEGGGQVLRTSLALATLTGEPVTIVDIRAGRPKPGLQRQHLTAVLAAAEVAGAELAGAELGSRRLEFRPGRPRAGDYRFAIGTAGSTTLVLQTVLPALWAAGGESTVELHGGTHNPMAPPFDFLQQSLAPLLQRMGAGLELELLRHGFHPAGGGALRARVAPARWHQLALETPVDRPELCARIVNSGIPSHVPEREAAVVAHRLALTPDRITIEEVDSPGPGNAVMVGIAGPETTELVLALAERRLSAEAVANRAVTATKRLLSARAPVGEHLADQLLLPMALAGGGTFRTVAPTAHLRTNAWVIEQFLPIAIEIGEHADCWRVAVRPR
ncbi:MAG: RNA 3'-terminal phosphate cyclase [Planctomycetes bacterium]|nr:RNA 3'-terminal phosphate cyclase [Planctomycetota bacterium]